MNLLIIVGFMLLGVALGYLLRRRPLLKGVQKAIMMTIYVLLFMLGLYIGMNPRVMEHLSTLGWEALLLTLGGVVGSLLFSAALWRYEARRRQRNVENR